MTRGTILDGSRVHRPRRPSAFEHRKRFESLSITAFYEKVKNVKADVAAVLVGTQSPPAEVLNSVKGVRQDVHLDP